MSRGHIEANDGRTAPGSMVNNSHRSAQGLLVTPQLDKM
jgi:hypothetical protein